MGRLGDISLGVRARIGILYPETGLLDEEFWAFAPAGTAVFVTRTKVPGPASIEVMTDMATSPDVARAATGFAKIDVSAIAYACTAAGFVRGLHGDEDLNVRLSRAAMAPATCTITASVRAMRSLGLRRISVATPYVRELDDRLAEFLSGEGFEIVARQHLGMQGKDISLVPLSEVRSLIRDVDRPDAEGVYVACTGLRTFELIDDLERELGKPVISANQATMWDVLRLAGVTDRQAPGVLFRAAAEDGRSRRAWLPSTP